MSNEINYIRLLLRGFGQIEQMETNHIGEYSNGKLSYDDFKILMNQQISNRIELLENIKKMCGKQNDRYGLGKNKSNSH